MILVDNADIVYDHQHVCVETHWFIFWKSIIYEWSIICVEAVGKWWHEDVFGKQHIYLQGTVLQMLHFIFITQFSAAGNGPLKVEDAFL